MLRKHEVIKIRERDMTSSRPRRLGEIVNGRARGTNISCTHSKSCRTSRICCRSFLISHIQTCFPSKPSCCWREMACMPSQWLFVANSPTSHLLPRLNGFESGASIHLTVVLNMSMTGRSFIAQNIANATKGNIAPIFSEFGLSILCPSSNR